MGREAKLRWEEFVEKVGLSHCIRGIAGDFPSRPISQVRGTLGD